jgi:hypothetical protein
VASEAALSPSRLMHYRSQVLPPRQVPQVPLSQLPVVVSEMAQGGGNVWMGNTYGLVIGWSDTQIVASVAGSAVSGVEKVEQNSAWSNALAFNVPTSFGGSPQVTLGGQKKTRGSDEKTP